MFVVMNIQYYGDYCFKISTKPAGRATEDVIIWTDPLSKDAGLRSPQGNVDVVLLSHQVEASVKDAFKPGAVVFDAPGEYAVRGISAFGFPSYRDTELGKVRGQNTVFVFDSEDLHICYLGALGSDLSPEVLDKLSGADILFIPVGGVDTVEMNRGLELVRKIEPRIIIPMHYKIPGLTLALETEKAFCDAVGNCSDETVTKLNVKKKDLEGKLMEVVVFERGV